MPAFWVVERTLDRHFPFRITIVQDGRTLLAVRTQSDWPGAGSQIFCLRETEFDGTEPLEPVERVPVAHLTRLGRKLSVTLDRGQRKRCEFLKVEKPYRDRPGTYEQIFFRTEQGVRAHRTSGRVELLTRSDLEVVIDSAERYAWRFPAARVTRRKLPIGDYALEVEDRIAAVVERKTLDNLLTDFACSPTSRRSRACTSSWPSWAATRTRRSSSRHSTPTSATPGRSAAGRPHTCCGSWAS